MPSDDFASLMESSGAELNRRADRRLSAGEVVEGTVIQVTGDSIFLDIGTAADARLDRAELGDRPPPRVGARFSATVSNPRSDGPVLTLGVGRAGSAVDASALEQAKESRLPVRGSVIKAVKGGLSVQVGRTSAFCPASQIDTGYVADLESYVGQELTFFVLEVRDEGRSVVLSRKALLEDERRARLAELSASLVPGSDVEGSVSSVTPHGAVVDLGGVEGFVHVSELAHHRVARPEDVVSVGEQGMFRVLSVEHTERGLKLRLSRKALEQKPEVPRPRADEILEATVVKLANHGVIVKTARGEGLVPLRELELPPGADHRRAYPVGRTFRVALLTGDAGAGRVRFSEQRVEQVEERQNYREFTAGSKPGPTGQGLGSLGALLRDKLGLPEPPPPEPPPEPEMPAQPEAPVRPAAEAAEPAAEASAAQAEAATRAPVSSEQPTPPARAAEPPARPVQPEQRPRSVGLRAELPEGVVRRKR